MYIHMWLILNLPMKGMVRFKYARVGQMPYGS